VVVPGDEAKPQAEAELRTTMAERTKASLEGDSVKIEGSIAAEYVQTDIAGRVQTKAQWLVEYFKPLAALIKTGQFRWDAWEEKDVQIRLFGSTAVGLFITLDSPTRNMETEAATAGIYHSTHWGDFPKVQKLTIDDILHGKEFKTPPPFGTFKVATKVDADPKANQHEWKMDA
jgi:hypothetical protein